MAEDEGLTGRWRSAPFDLGAMESSELVFLPGGWGWGVLDNAAGGLEIVRLRWHCAGPGILEAVETWLVSGTWAPGGGDRFASVDSAGPAGEVLRTGYRLAPERLPGDDGEPVDVLRLDRPLLFADRYARADGRPDPASDPLRGLAP